jgi:hypothetical protein
VHHAETSCGAARRDRRDVGDVALDELAVLDGAAMAGDQVVEDDDAIAGAVSALAAWLPM